MATRLRKLATVIPLRRGLAVSPVQAISVGARAAKSSGLVWLTRGIRLPGGRLANLPLRSVLRAPRRTVMTSWGSAPWWPSPWRWLA